MQHKAKVYRRTLTGRDEFNDWIFTLTPGSEIWIHAEELTDEEISHAMGDLSKEIRRVYMGSLNDFNEKCLIKIASDCTTPGATDRAFSWSLNDMNEVKSVVRSGGGRGIFLECMIKRIALQ